MKQYEIDQMLTQKQIEKREENKEYQQRLGQLLADAYSANQLQEMLALLKEAKQVNGDQRQGGTE